MSGKVGRVVEIDRLAARDDSDSPLATYIMPSVAMNGGIFSLAIKRARDEPDERADAGWPPGRPTTTGRPQW